MDLRFSPEENKFREEMRTFFREKIPASIRTKVMESRHLDKEEMVQSHKILHAKGLTVPHWPKEWGGADWTPVQHYIYTEELQFNGVPQPLPFNVSMCGPVVIAFGTPEQKKRFLPRMAALDDWWCQGFSEPAPAPISPALDHGSPQGRPLYRQRAEDLDHAGAVRGLDLLPRAHRSRCQEAARHLVPADRHEDAGAHRAPDPDAGRRTRGERGVLRRRQGAGRQPDRPGEPRLGLRQVPARQRAHRHRPVGYSKQRVQKIKELASKVMAGDRPLIEDERFREKVAAVEVELKALEMTQMRVLSEDRQRKDKLPNPKSSILKIKGSEIQQATTALLLEVAGRWRCPTSARRRSEFGSNEPPIDLDWAAPAAPAISTTAR
jgi:alkylation response protein AidB-like acyl-CoA dehydrogenase